MKRDVCTKKLVRILETIDAGQVPAKVKEVYVFGSYARGALEPNDLDLLVYYEDPVPDYWQMQREPLCQAGLPAFDAAVKVWKVYRAKLRDALCKPRERVDLNLADTSEGPLDVAAMQRRETFVLLWSESDRDWRGKLAGLAADPKAGRAPREEAFPIRRLRADFESVREVMAILAEGKLVLARSPIASIELGLDPRNVRRFRKWMQEGRLGKQLEVVLPYALDWLQRCGQEPPEAPETEMRPVGHASRRDGPPLRGADARPVSAEAGADATVPDSVPQEGRPERAAGLRTRPAVDVSRPTFPAAAAGVRRDLTPLGRFTTLSSIPWSSHGENHGRCSSKNGESLS